MSQAEITGRCLCGAVGVTARPKRPHIEACHCDMCRRWGGSAFLGVQCGSDVSFSGQENIARFASSAWAERGFCRVCGSNIFYRFVPADNYSLLAGLFDELEGITMNEQIFIDEKPEYYGFAQETVVKTGPEVLAEAKEAGFDFDEG